MQEREERNSLMVLDMNKNIVQVSADGGGCGEAGKRIQSSIDQTYRFYRVTFFLPELLCKWISGSPGYNLGNGK